MFRLMSVVALVFAAAGCSWPPSLATPPAVPNAGAPVEEQAEAVPQVRAPERPAIPRVSPPAVPRLGGSRGGLL